DRRIAIARAFVFGVTRVPDAVFLEPRILRQLTFAAPFGLEVGRIVTPQLPLTRHAGSITGIAHPVSETAFLRVHDSEGAPVGEVFLTGHKRKSGGRTQRRSVGMCKARAGSRQPIEIGSLVRCSAVTAKAFVPDVVAENEHDIRTRGCSGQRQSALE